MGHWPVVCYDGTEGLQRATTEPWDIIVLDRMLPNQVDGLTILTTLRGLGIKTPVIVLSALTALDERVRGLKSGGDDYLTKPFALIELLTRSEALIRRSKNSETDRILQYADSPIVTLSPDMGHRILVDSFVVVVIGGVGSFPGAIIGGIIAGEILSLTSMFNPAYSHVMLFVVMALVLIFRPQGLMGQEGREDRKSTRLNSSH